MKKMITAILVGGAALGLSACSVPDTNYHGTVSGTEVPAAAAVEAPAAPVVPAEPVTITGSGEGVTTADLKATGYTVSYQAESFCIIVEPVEADGSDGMSIVNECASDMDASSVSGTAIYKGTGRTTFHVFNTQGPWSLTFTPLA